jgi:tRNA (guanine37-N1)-methyltransferase
MLNSEDAESVKCGQLKRSSYLVIGDIAIINASNEKEIEECRAFAKCLSQKAPYLKAFYAKLSTEGEYRVAKLVHLLGEERTATIVKEYGIALAVDIAKAYYNSRLAEEHRRIALMSKDGEKVLDLFSGIGGFALHIASLRSSIIFANDWNKEAVSLLFKSFYFNRKKMKGSIYATVMDAAKLLEELKGKIVFDRIIMNSPTNSVNYLEGALTLSKAGGKVHLYVLSSREEEAIKQLIMPSTKSDASIEAIEEVIEYSPSKSVFRVDLRKT